jgi:PhnB protein
MMMRYKESPDTPPPGAIPENWGDKIMHASLTIAGSTLMASDGPKAGPANFAGFSLSIDLDDEAKAERIFQALAESGAVQMPLMKTFFARRFGMLADRFGVGWMVIVA